ncbi:sialate O-acetylesterase [Brevundimonas sp.]|uniref:sialate O-acetylesterase n=1 Tax=Brevundimonas sp. TaxID=1871086 RepID=UPI002737B1F7|nr:sialate O-acetylesterase [Brevundimonas sp.]MDP3801887.1 sialate O-acetylesterase [Brevundimonas sp.]
MKQFLKAAGLAVVLAGAATGVLAQTSPTSPLLADVFQDHAVLQRDRPIAVWGRAAPDSQLAVTLAGTTVAARADAEGRWRAVLPALPAGGPHELSVAQDGRTQVLTDLLIGDVWLCSGQSNMEFGVRSVTNADTEIGASADPQLRLLLVGRSSRPSATDAMEPGSVWRVSGPESVRDFSATCFFMGKQLRRSQNVPVGLIAASWGGSVIEDWLSEPALRRIGGYDLSLDTLAVYARSPEEGRRIWAETSDRWWRDNDPGSAGSTPWYSPAYDDSSWPTAAPEGFWESSSPELMMFNGVIWHRTTVTLTAAQAAGEATLRLGPVDDVDTTWINGRKIGGREGWDTPRTYSVPAGVLHEGRNLIAVGVLDTGGGGGLWGPAAEKTLTLADGSVVSLADPWRRRVAAPISELGNLPRTPWIGGSGVTTLSNGMIEPLEGYGLAGVAWYQGESNVGDPEGYRRLLHGLFADWRDRFDNEDLPFFAVQLANFGPATSAPTDSAWAALREIQREVVEADGNAGLAVAIDIGDRYDIHPTNKQEVGRRLALAARAVAHGEEGVPASPSPRDARITGEVVTVSFDRVGQGLVVYGASRPVGFELCGAAGCRFVDARVDGATVVLDAADVPDATTVRFCWADSPVCNLYGDAGLPAVPFDLPVTRPR